MIQNMRQRSWIEKPIEACSSTIIDFSPCIVGITNQGRMIDKDYILLWRGEEVALLTKEPGS